MLIRVKLWAAATASARTPDVVTRTGKSALPLSYAEHWAPTAGLEPVTSPL